MKKLMPLLVRTTAIYLFAVLISLSALTANAAAIPGSDGKKEYINFLGKVEEVVKNENMVSLLVRGESDTILFNVFDGTVVLDGGGKQLSAQEIKEDQDILLAYKSTTPATASIPSQINPEIVVVMPTVGFVKVDVFGSDHLSSDGRLKINVSSETPIFALDGTELTENDIYDKTLIVYYAIATFSIPPQTPPIKIIVMGENDTTVTDSDDNTINSDFYGDDYFMADGVKMIPLAKAGLEFGYSVEWNAEKRIVTLTKGNSSILITIGDTMFGYNRSNRYFDVAPEIRNSRTYVPESILDLLRL